MLEQNFKNCFIKHIEKIKITRKKNLHCFLTVHRFDYDKIKFRFYKKAFYYKRLRLFFLFDTFEFVIINYVQIDITTRNFIEKKNF